MMIDTPLATLTLNTQSLALNPPLVMGILNVTPDSMSDGGRFNSVTQAVDAGLAMVKQGAALIDVGGESTRPGAAVVSVKQEMERVVPVVERLAVAGVIVSLDTRRAAVMAAGLKAGAQIINDVSALLHDPMALAVVADAGCPVVLMHSPDASHTLHGVDLLGDGRMGDNALSQVMDWLGARIAAVVAGGVAQSNIIIDPGIGFGKTTAQNVALLQGLSHLHALGCPVLLGASRKRIISALSADVPPTERLGGSLAIALKGATQGVQILRVHDVTETVQALRVWNALQAGASPLPS